MKLLPMNTFFVNLVGNISLATVQVKFGLHLYKLKVQQHPLMCLQGLQHYFLYQYVMHLITILQMPQL